MLFFFFGASVLASGRSTPSGGGTGATRPSPSPWSSSFGLGALNLQIAVYRELGVGLTSSPFATLFFGVTGGFLALLVGLVLAVVTAFRSVGGRTRPPTPTAWLPSRSTGTS